VNRTRAMALAGLAAVGAARAELAVENVTVAYDSAAKTLNVGYDLSGGNAIITLVIETNSVALPDRHVTRLTGDVCRLVEAGTGKSIVWDLGREWRGNQADLRARVEAWPESEPPLYMVLDLTKAGASPIPVTYYRSEEALPYGGVTNEIYKTFLMPFRRIDPGTFTMGSPAGEVGRNSVLEPQRAITLTTGFYIGVYEVTHRQYNQVRNTGSPSGYNGPAWIDMRPVSCLSYYHIRENWANVPMAVTWPDTFDVGADSFMGMISARTGMDFDLPTSAQWEYACRAGTTKALNILGGTNTTSATADAMMNLAGRYKYDGGMIMITGVWYNAEAAFGGNVNNVPDTYATARVGSYLPNAWGLYDMHGNVYEWVLDWAYTDGAVLPPGPLSDPNGLSYPSGATSNRIARSGSFLNDASNCRSAFWSYGTCRGGWNGNHVGLRVVRRLGRW